MKLGGARVIAVDDRKADLDGLVRALHRIGVGVLPFHYKGERSLRQCDPGVRIVFSDISLMASAGPAIQRHRTVASVMDRLMGEENGPWLLVAWTASPNEVDALHDVLTGSLGRRAPMKSFGIDKGGFVNARGGFRIREIASEIEKRVMTDPVVAAVFDLEMRAASAARDITRSLVELAALNSTADATLPDVLTALSRAVDAASPPSPVNVFQAVAPAFGDRLVRKPVGHAERKVWSDAFAAATGQALSPTQRVHLNASLHLDPPGRPGERGALCHVTSERWETLERLLGASLEEIAFLHFIERDKAAKSLRKSFPLPKIGPSFPDSDLMRRFVSSWRWFLMEVVPACDASNQKRGLRRSLVCLGVPSSAGAQKKAGTYVVELPTLELAGEVLDLYVSAKTTLSPPPPGFASLKPIARLRDQLLDGIMQHVASSQSRLGWTSF